MIGPPRDKCECNAMNECCTLSHLAHASGGAGQGAGRVLDALVRRPVCLFHVHAKQDARKRDGVV